MLDDISPPLLPVRSPQPAPVGHPPPMIQAWFDHIVDAVVPEPGGSLPTARRAADAYARRAKADNTRRAYRAGVRAWCAWCDLHTLPCLPGRAADVVAFLAAERGCGLSVNTIDLRRAAIRYLHYVAGLPVPTAEAQVTETLAGIHREAADLGQLPVQKLAATASILREILGLIPADLAGLRDEALFRRLYLPPTRREGGAGVRPGLVVGVEALDPGSIARILKLRAAAGGFDPHLVSGHSLKRGALSTGMERGVHPTRLKQLGRHRSYAVLDTYLEMGDPFEGHPMNGVI